MKKSKRAMPYWICIAIGALIFVGVASMRSIWTLSEREEILSGLCDALFVPGALLTCVGLLTFTAREGVLDIIPTVSETYWCFSRPESISISTTTTTRWRRKPTAARARMRRCWLGWRSSCWPACALSSTTTGFNMNRLREIGGGFLYLRCCFRRIIMV